MTNTEAIKILNECRDRGFERTTYTIEEYHTARDMAIKALQEQADEDHDGCKDCVYQDNPQDAMPCRECKHNYMDKWKVRPSAEPREVLYSGDGYADGEMVYDMAECPNCGREFEDGDETWNCNFCPDCGQALKWEGVSD